MIDVYLLMFTAYKYYLNRPGITFTKSKKMDRDELIDSTLANMLDVNPLISNIDNEVSADINVALVSIYERNMDILNAV